VINLIFNTTSQDYEIKNLPVPSNYPHFPLKYLYPQRYGYNPIKPVYAESFPLYEKSSSTPTGLEGLLYQRQEIIHSKIEMVLTEINQRRIMKDENLYQIDFDQNSLQTLIFGLRRYYIDRRRIELEKKIIDLEQEKRRERTTYFRDILFLRKELRESLVEKLEEDQKVDIFTDQQGESL